MRIGLIPTPSRSGSVRHVMATLRDAITSAHEPIFLDPAYAFSREEERRRMAAEFVGVCDAIVGIIDPTVLAMRQELAAPVPYLLLMLGTMGRGAFRFRHYLPTLSTNDCLIVNSGADDALCELFFANAQAARVPLAFDDSTFFRTDDGDRGQIRRQLGFGDATQMLLYAGRVIPEKNLHTVLRTFAALLHAGSDARLVLAGRMGSNTFTEFGVQPVDYPRTLATLGHALGIPDDRVLAAGDVSPGDLRDLYNAADASINLTLHHDENFGLAAVEAMACGLPVVGSAWGGLKDTIRDGVTGYQVSAVTGPAGVKVNWWEAATRVHAILSGDATGAAARIEGPRYARQYGQEVFRDRLLSVVGEVTRRAHDRPAEPLLGTPFAEEFWRVCDPAGDTRAPFRRGARSMELYREMIGLFAGTSVLAVAPDEPLAESQILTLATPVVGDERLGFWPDDPLYPLQCEVPARLVRPFRSLLAAFAREPVSTLGRLVERNVVRTEIARDALRFAMDSGLLLRSVGTPQSLEPRSTPALLGKPMLSLHRLPRDGIDFVVSG